MYIGQVTNDRWSRCSGRCSACGCCVSGNNQGPSGRPHAPCTPQFGAVVTFVGLSWDFRGIFVGSSWDLHQGQLVFQGRQSRYKQLPTCRQARTSLPKVGMSKPALKSLSRSVQVCPGLSRSIQVCPVRHPSGAGNGCPRLSHAGPYRLRFDYCQIHILVIASKGLLIS